MICDDGLPSEETRLARGSWPHPHTYTWPENGAAVTAWKQKSKNILSTFAADYIYLTLYIQAQQYVRTYIYICDPKVYIDFRQGILDPLLVCCKVFWL